MIRNGWLLALTMSVACADGTTTDKTDTDTDTTVDTDTVATGRVADIQALTGNAVAGETVYATNCTVGCHLADGTGETNGGIGADFTVVLSTLDEAVAIETVLDGKGLMGAYDGFLEDQEIADAVAYIYATF